MANKRPDGDGLVRKRKDGRWEGRIVVGHKANGTPIFRSVFAKTQKMLMEKLHQHIETYRDVELSEECDIPLGEWLDRWKENYAAYAVRPNTLSSYESMIENYIKPRLGMMRISDITTEDIQQMYNGLKENGRINEHDTMGFQLADSSIRRIHMMLHEAMDAAVREHLVVDNPTNGTRIPKPNYPPKQILTEEQVERFMTELENDAVWHDLFYTELTTGLRRGEICGLQWQDLDFSTGKLRIRRAVIAMKHQPCCVGETKTDAGRRTITLPPHTLEMLKNRKKTSYSQWIFPNPVRPEAPMAPSTPYHQILKVQGKGAIEIFRESKPAEPIQNIESEDFIKVSCNLTPNKSKASIFLRRIYDEERAEKLLNALGLLPYWQGYYIILQALHCIADDEYHITAIQKEIYLPIAEKLGCSCGAIDAEIRRMSERAWNTNPNLLKEITMMELTKRPRAQEFLLSLFFASCIENRRIEIS